jgi:heme exporter protein B
VLALFVDLDPAGIPVLMLGLLIGTPALSLLGAIAAALTLGARRPGVLVALVVLPFYLPPLIFGSGAVEASLTADGARAHLLLLGAVTLAALALAPLATAAALRQALD